MTTSIKQNNTYQELFNTRSGKAYLTELPKVSKIFSGQSFLYRQHGTRSMVIDIRLTDVIDQELLQIAVNRSLQRYPYLSSMLVRKDAHYNLTHDPLPLIVAQQHSLRVLGSKDVNYHLIDITFEQKRLFVSYHHALVDGRGIMPFVRTLLYYYISSKVGLLYGVPKVNLANDPLSLDEMQEPFSNLPELKIPQNSTQDHGENSYSLPESRAFDPQADSYRFETVIDQTSFMTFAKAHNATPAIAIGIMLEQAIHRAHPKTTDPVMVNLASDLRSVITYQKTARNCVNSISLPINTPITTDSDFTETATAFRKQIQLQKKPEYILQTINKMQQLFDTLDALDSFQEKQKMMSAFDTNLINTFVLSYSGQLRLGSLEKYIDEVHTYMSGTNGLSVQMLAANQKLFIDILQSFSSDIYVKEFRNILQENHIKYNSLNKKTFQTPYSLF
ncbi:hypothetical protein QS460_06945 [Liquorilactobacillus mali]|uniref:Condensation domain-containing protein n=1 Tax=Liquorilactobacillus mali TaxID=1618 RepID=A0A0R2FE26_9LACO|nr:hypothetical protein [Liquorilactobacillus mali]KRN26688.1 hypothetical protein IV36_GL001598 [Liquorilactobacillus mali]MDN7145663.1 hypothetical protein [Liquorilactobacillus mali]